MMDLLELVIFLLLLLLLGVLLLGICIGYIGVLIPKITEKAARFLTGFAAGVIFGEFVIPLFIEINEDEGLTEMTIGTLLLGILGGIVLYVLLLKWRRRSIYIQTILICILMILYGFLLVQLIYGRIEENGIYGIYIVWVLIQILLCGFMLYHPRYAPAYIAAGLGGIIGGGILCVFLEGFASSRSEYYAAQEIYHFLICHLPFYTGLILQCGIIRSREKKINHTR